MSKSKRPSIQGQKHSDLFQTDPAALFPLLPFIPPIWRIWESAAGKGQLMRWLNEFEGRTCYGSDIIYGHDFLTQDLGYQYDCIVTNPPYSIKTRWIKRCYELGKPFALLLPYTAMEGRDKEPRQQLYMRYGVDLLFLKNRVKFTTPNGKKGGSWFPAMWLTWKILPERIMFEE